MHKCSIHPEKTFAEPEEPYKNAALPQPMKGRALSVYITNITLSSSCYSIKRPPTIFSVELLAMLARLDSNWAESPLKAADV